MLKRQNEGVEALTVISTGVDPPATAQRQWDDGGNALAADRRVMLCYKRNVETNARLEAAGVEVIRVPGSELGWARGGPRAMSCAVSRDSLTGVAQPGIPEVTVADIADAASPAVASLPGVGAVPAIAPVPDVAAPPAAAATVADLARPGNRSGRPWQAARAVPPEQRLWPAAAGTGKVRHVELRVSSRSQGDHIVLALAGEIDLYTAPRLQSELTSVLTANKSARIVVDMSAVEFCDSTGMNVLLAAHRAAIERGGDLTLAAPRPPVRKILGVTGLHSVFTIEDDLPAVAGQ